MGCENFSCRKQDFCEDHYNCEDSECECYGACEHCLYEDDEYECPVARNCERMLRD